MKNYNINGIFILIISLLVISAFSKSLNHKREDYDSGYYETPNNGYFDTLTPLEPTSGVRTYTITLLEKNLAPDGFTKQVLTVDGQYPGPILRAFKGETVRITVVNKLSVPSVIHWHGIFQIGTNWFDGVTGETQCSIPSGESFDYEFNVGEQTGTYWYHSHTGGQYMAGVLGALIVHDQQDPYLNDYDLEYAVTLSDWYHDDITKLIKERSAPGYTGINPIPDSGLISGVGRYDCSAAPKGSQCRSDNPLAVYKVIPGKRYRFRIINTSGLSHFVFSIDNHQMTIIEADGIYSKPRTVDKLPISIAQRYSVIVKADQKVDNYWIRASIDPTCNPPINTTINHNSAINYNVTGILRYEGADSSDPTTKEFSDNPPNCLSLPADFLKLLNPEPIPSATKSFRLEITFGATKDKVPEALINNSSYVVNNDHPTLEQFLDDKVPATGFPRNQNLYSYDNENEYVDLVMINNNGAVHPFHLHGHAFYIMGSGNGTEVDESKFHKEPFSRDVFSLSPTSWTVFRYQANNPGVWALHCHIEWHLGIGMVVQLLELPSALSQRIIPPAVNNLCTKYSKSKKRSLVSGLSGRPRRI